MLEAEQENCPICLFPCDDGDPRVFRFHCQHKVHWKCMWKEIPLPCLVCKAEWCDDEDSSTAASFWSRFAISACEGALPSDPYRRRVANDSREKDNSSDGSASKHNLSKLACEICGRGPWGTSCHLCGRHICDDCLVICRICDTYQCSVCEQSCCEEEVAVELISSQVGSIISRKFPETS